MLKKLIGVIFVLVLALCMATTAFAAVSAEIINAEAVTEITVPAGTFATVSIRGGGFDLLVTGEGDFTVKYKNVDYPAVDGKVIVPDIYSESTFTRASVRITNQSGVETTYSAVGLFPEGSRTNPSVFEAGANKATVEGGNDVGYFYTWIAETCGTLTITMGEGDWYYALSNITTGVYCAEHNTGEDTVVPSESVAVRAGDEIRLTVNSYDPKNPTVYPGGDVNFTVSFEPGHANVQHVEAVEPGCHYIGNIEHWFCADCGSFWQDEAMTQVTNSKNVLLPALGSDHVVHIDAVAPGCHYIGNIEYWFCPDCEQYWQNAALTQLTNSKRVLLPATGSDKLTHVEAVKPGCETNGNIEYWFCSDCEQFWQNEALTQLTNSKRVILPALEHNYVDGECTNCGGNPNTGDAGVMSVIITMLASAMGTVALVSKKKEF